MLPYVPPRISHILLVHSIPLLLYKPFGTSSYTISTFCADLYFIYTIVRYIHLTSNVPMYMLKEFACLPRTKYESFPISARLRSEPLLTMLNSITFVSSNDEHRRRRRRRRRRPLGAAHSPSSLSFRWDFFLSRLCRSRCSRSLLRSDRLDLDRSRLRDRSRWLQKAKALN